MIDLSNHCNHSDCPHYVYITLGINERKGFLYIGQHRCKRAGEFDNNYFGSGLYIKRIEKKYGKEYIRNNFKCIPIWWCKDQDETNEMEQFFIAEYETMEIGENICEGGSGTSGYVHTEEQKQKQSFLMKNNNPFKGKTHSEDTKEKIRQSNIRRRGLKRKPLSEECKRKLSEARKGKYCGENHPNFGKHLSEETRNKLSKAHKGKVLSEEHKQKISLKTKGENNPMYGKPVTEERRNNIHKALWVGDYIAYKNGVKIGSFDSWQSIANFLHRELICGIKTSIRKCVNGRLETAYGYQWRRLPKGES